MYHLFYIHLPELIIKLTGRIIITTHSKLLFNENNEGRLLSPDAICSKIHNEYNKSAAAAAAAAKSLQSCPTLCNHRDSSPPGSPVPGILQARTLEWVAISSPTHESKKVKVKSFSLVQLLVTPWTAAYQAPLSMGYEIIWNIIEM